MARQKGEKREKGDEDTSKIEPLRKKFEYIGRIHERVINRFAYGSSPFHRAFSLGLLSQTWTV